MKLYGYFRSSAAFRVRIALNLKKLTYEAAAIHLRRNDQSAPDYLGVNPQGLVPALEDDGRVLIQSLAIIEYLDETHPDPPLLPKHPADRARVRALAEIVACDIHPINNLRVLKYLAKSLNVEEPARDEWYRHWVREGFGPLESQLAARGAARFCFGDTPTLADVCLVPQVANAQRLNVEMAPYPRIAAVNAACLEVAAFRDAHEERKRAIIDLLLTVTLLRGHAGRNADRERDHRRPGLYQAWDNGE